MVLLDIFNGILALCEITEFKEEATVIYFSQPGKE